MGRARDFGEKEIGWRHSQIPILYRFPWFKCRDKDTGLPYPRYNGNLSLMADSPYFTLLDIESAYWHIPIHPDDKDRTGFVTPFGSFRYERLAYGLAGAPSAFQKIMDVTLMGLKNIYALVYLDDILIFSDTIQEHARRVRMVLDRIRELTFKLNLGTCAFPARDVAYLGHLVTQWRFTRCQQIKSS